MGIVYIYYYVDVYVCAHPEAINSAVILTLYDWLNDFCCFSVKFYGTCSQFHQ